MIPYWSPGPWQLGPLTIHAFGIMVGLAIIVGTAVGQRRAEKLGLHPKVFSEAVIWMFVLAFFMAHVVSVVFYFPDRLKKNPLELLMFWRGISSFGGFLGAVIALLVFIRVRRLPVWTTFDAVGYGLVHGWILGRTGCSLAHDHPGKCTNFILGIKYPDVALECPTFHARHDLGFYEMLFTVFLTIVVVLANRKKRFSGFTVALICLLYAPVRFMLDFLRISDKTHFGLTAGHYFSIAVFIIGLWVLLTRRNAPEESFPYYDPRTDEGGLLPGPSERQEPKETKKETKGKKHRSS